MVDEPERSGGAVRHSLALIAEVLRCLKARAILAGEEAKAAGVQYGVAAAMMVGALFIAILGYVFFVVTAVFAIGLAFDSEHAWIALLGGAAVCHVGGAIALLFAAKKRVGDSPFPETFAEIEKDRIWLTHLSAKN